MNFVNVLNKLPLKLSLSYQGLVLTSNPTMEDIGATNPEYQPLQV